MDISIQCDCLLDALRKAMAALPCLIPKQGSIYSQKNQSNVRLYWRGWIS